jgi:predicted MFS family arabinose efflux permease
MNTVARPNTMSIPRTIAWAMWTVGAFFYAYQYILRVMPSIIMNDIMQQFSIDVTTFGQFSGVYYIGYALMHVPLGILLDRYGPKSIMPICALITVIGLLPIIFADYWLYPLIGRFLIGMGSSAAILSTFKIIRISFKEEQFTRMLSFAVTIGLIGAIYGGGPVNYMCDTLGYKTVTEILCILGIVLAVGAYLLVPNIEVEASSGILTDIKEVFTSRQVLSVCFLAGLMVGPLEGFADVWGKEFLQKVYGFNSSIAASLPSTMFVGMCFGGPLLSLIASKTKSDLVTIFGAGIIMTISFALLLTGTLSATSISVLFTVVGICCAYQIIAIYKASTYVREGIVGLTTAVANMIIMIFGYFFHSAIGFILKLCNGFESALAYKYAISIIPITLCIGALGFMWIYRKETQGSNLIMNETLAG